MILLAAAALLAGCVRSKTIPDGELREIFKRIYLVNSYMEQNRGNTSRIFNIDSLDVYRPILNEYGYSVDDLKYTMHNFSKRKSYRLSDVVDEAIKEIEDEESWYRYQMAAADSIDVRAQRMFRRTVFSDSLIRAKKVADTAKLRLSAPIEPGSYEVAYSYFIDSLDKNRNLKATISLIDSNGRIHNTVTNWLGNNRRQRYSAKLTPEGRDTAIVIVFGNYPQKELKTPDIRIDSLEVFYMPPVEVALDSAGIVLFRYKLQFDEDENDSQPQDSVALPLHTDGPAPQGSDNP